MMPRHDVRPNAVRGTEFPSDFRDFIRLLNTHQVDYLLVGGYAVGYYGHARATEDIDFFYRCTPSNVTRLVLALADFGAPSVVIDVDHLSQQEAMATFGEPPNRIDLLASLSGVTFAEASEQKATMTFGGERLPIIGLEALRRNKRASGRKKDRDDLRRLATAR